MRANCKMNPALLDIIQNYTIDEIKQQLNNIFQFAEEYKKALENELLERQATSINENENPSKGIRYACEADNTLRESRDSNLESEENEEFDDELNIIFKHATDSSVESINYYASQYIQDLVDGYSEDELMRFLKKYKISMNTDLEPAIHYQAELCAIKLQNIKKQHLAEQIYESKKCCPKYGRETKISTLFCEFCGEKFE